MKIEKIGSLLLLLSIMLAGCRLQPKSVVLHTSVGDIRIQSTETGRDWAALTLLSKDSCLFYKVLRDNTIQFGPKGIDWSAQQATGDGNALPLRSGALARINDRAFFIVEGKVQTDATLDALAQKNGISFSAEARNLYKQYGGLPQLQGKYRVFGQVTAGMEVVSRIAAVPRNAQDRPLEDITLRITAQ